MKKLLFIYILLISVVLISGCSKKEKTQKADETNPNDESKIEFVEFKCDGMHCSGCEESISASVNNLKGIKEVIADAKNKIVKVKFINNMTSKSEIEKSINAAGYDTQDSKSENKHNCDMEKK